MRHLEAQIYIEISIHEDLSMSEIIKKIQGEKKTQEETLKPSRITIIRAVKSMKNQGLLKHGKIPKKRKRFRYSIKEDNTKQDLTKREYKFINKKPKRIIPDPKITQRNLSSMITREKQFYKKELEKLKKEPDYKYYIFHGDMIFHCLDWMTRLTWAINSGMLGDSKNKLELAKRNKERYEELLQTLVYNIKTRDEKKGNNTIKALYEILLDQYFTYQIPS